MWSDVQRTHAQVAYGIPDICVSLMVASCQLAVLVGMVSFVVGHVIPTPPPIPSDASAIFGAHADVQASCEGVVVLRVPGKVSLQGVRLHQGHIFPGRGTVGLVRVYSVTASFRCVDIAQLCLVSALTRPTFT